MIDVYVRQKQKPTHCRKCPFLNIDDECILQSNEANFDAEDFEALYRNCPVLVVERDAYVPIHRAELAEEMFSKRELAEMYAVKCGYTEQLEAELRELRKKLQGG